MIYKTWAKTNAKFCKALIKRNARLLKRKSFRKLKPAKVGLVKPLRKRKPIQFDLVEEPRSLCKRPAAAGSSLVSSQDPAAAAAAAATESPASSSGPVATKSSGSVVSCTAETEECDSDSDCIVGVCFMSAGNEVEEFGELTCKERKVKIEKEDDVKVLSTSRIERLNTRGKTMRLC